jgi:hypothetical protein
MRVEGRCHCGAIQYEAEVQPGTVVVCHCADCQMQSGSAFRANIPAPAHTFRLLRGVPKRYIKWHQAVRDGYTHFARTVAALYIHRRKSIPRITRCA